MKKLQQGAEEKQRPFSSAIPVNPWRSVVSLLVKMENKESGAEKLKTRDSSPDTCETLKSVVGTEQEKKEHEELPSVERNKAVTWVPKLHVG